MFSANSSQVSEDRLYVEDVFSTYLYTGNGSTQTITNGIDLAGKGGMVWIKNRAVAQNHFIQSTQTSGVLSSNTTSALSTPADFVANSNGFTSSWGTTNGNTYASWTFRKAPKFFDVVTWTGNGASSRTLSHALKTYPGCAIIKRTDSASDWWVWHQYNSGGYLQLNSTSAENSNGVYRDGDADTFTIWNVFGVSANVSGATYVAYLFADSAGGFGNSGTDSVITCGSFTTDGSGNATVNLGWEPQWLLTKQSSSAGAWVLEDNMRGFDLTNDQWLFPNTSGAEVAAGALDAPTATGFTISGRSASTTFIYIAIRRGPMRTPTSGTSVFSPVTYTSSSSPTVINAGFPVDLTFLKLRTLTDAPRWVDRLRGTTQSTNPEIQSSNTSSEGNYNTVAGAGQNSVTIGGFGTFSCVSYMFRRAPSFFDVVCYTGTGGSSPYNHNLGVVPELIISKRRNSTSDWVVATQFTSTNFMYGELNSTYGAGSPFNYSSTYYTARPTATQVFPGGASGTGVTNGTYVAYLFASCPGVSKVFSFTGNGGSQTINCGFSGGARFVMIKRTDSTGDWWVWDTARGLVSGNDPALRLNSTAAETTGIDSIDPDSSGFIVNQDATTNINVNGASYIGLAVA